MRLLVIPLAYSLSVTALAQVSPPVVERDTELPLEVTASDTVTFITVGEKSADFPGGFSAMMDYLGQHIHFPEEEQEDRIEGKVFLQFMVLRDGSVGDVRVLRGVPGGMGLEREAVRVVKSMPRWTPASKNGVTVDSQVMVPIMFKLAK